MEAIVRRPFQGVINIVRFNWHFYVIAGVIIAVLFGSLMFLSEEFRWIVNLSVILIVITLFLSLVVSYCVYDYSGLYNFKWLDRVSFSSQSNIVNIHAGFDETSFIFKRKYPNAKLTVFDFYDPKSHTEVSIKRARKAYGAYPGTKNINTNHIPLTTNSMDIVFNIFSIHEIRKREERINFLRKQHGVLNLDGRCIIVEHLRDLPNFMAYSIGFFHFYSLYEWKDNFLQAGFVIDRMIKITPFVSVFILKKRNGDTP